MADRAKLVQRARNLVRQIRNLARRTETLRRIPEETVQDLRAAGALRAAQPERYGGLGLPFDAVFDVAAELGRGCGSTAWCYSIWASHNWLAGMFPEQAQEEYWANGCDSLSSTSFNPVRGRVEQAQGGYRVSGKWDFASGVDAADWMLIVGNCDDVALMLMLPKTDYAVQDTWFVSGLLGTGSKDVVVNDVFVPEHRAVPMQDMRDALTPGRTFHDTANYRIPLRSILSFTLGSPVLGMAQGALEAFERARQGAASPAIQMRLAESAAEIAAARALMQADSREISPRRSGRKCQPPATGCATAGTRYTCRGWPSALWTGCSRPAADIPYSPQRSCSVFTATSTLRRTTLLSHGTALPSSMAESG